MNLSDSDCVELGRFISTVAASIILLEASVTIVRRKSDLMVRSGEVGGEGEGDTGADVNSALGPESTDKGDFSLQLLICSHFFL